MGSAISAAAPYAFAAMLAAPAVVAVSALILASAKRPALATWTFAAGAASLDLLVGIGLYGILVQSGASGNDDFAAILDILLGVIFVGLGIGALRGEESPEKQQAARERIEKIASGPLRMLLVAGVVVQIVNADALVLFAGGVKEIVKEDVATGPALAAIAVSVAIMLLPYYLPALVYAVTPGQSQRLLRPLNDWVLGHTRLLEIVLGFGFGLLLLFKGIGGLT